MSSTVNWCCSQGTLRSGVDLSSSNFIRFACEIGESHRQGFRLRRTRQSVDDGTKRILLNAQEQFIVGSRTVIAAKVGLCSGMEAQHSVIRASYPVGAFSEVWGMAGLTPATTNSFTFCKNCTPSSIISSHGAPRVQISNITIAYE
eukprot:m.212609 g.212609  ORF g.212609 m.212609 type:complete len:146 (+) comp15505_c0_seq4:3-440(+)